MTVQSLAKTQTRGEIIETILVKGDLAKLTADERNSYYLRVCESVGLNPLTRPLEYITLSGRLVLYARKDATDQLRSIHNISVTDLAESERDGVFIVTAKVQNGDGRTDIAKGAVNIANLKGEALANAIMKTETKAKRRATLSICGLGLLDETEIEDSAGSVSPPPPPAKSNVPSPPKSRVPSPPPPPTEPHSFKAATTADWAGKMLDYIAAAKTSNEVVQWDVLNRDNLKLLASKDPVRLKTVMKAMKDRKEELTDHISRMPVHPREGLAGADEVVTADGEIVPAKAKAPSIPDAAADPEKFLAWADKAMASSKSLDELEAKYNGGIEIHAEGMFPPDKDALLEMYQRHERRFEP